MFLLGAGISAFITYVFISIALFTKGWVTAAVNAFQANVKHSAGIFPWGCVNDNTCDFFWENADGWAITVFLAMLFAWIVQFFVLISVIAALVLKSWRYHLSRGFTSQQLIVTILLLYVLIVYGATYDRNTEIVKTLGVDIYLDYSYWLCMVPNVRWRCIQSKRTFCFYQMFLKFAGQ
ncbi:unnamed protein product [Cylicocyclus nassatus]|uniref:Uncharacterized protein n=1 Tax=Cylicocyclus nassatus TaxID=53992 RepID=A0AA36MCS7_CYLNA|nr:unnamed protein product [Cylicocyclus nassatus]